MAAVPQSAPDGRPFIEPLTLNPPPPAVSPKGCSHCRRQEPVPVPVLSLHGTGLHRRSSPVPSRWGGITQFPRLSLSSWRAIRVQTPHTCACRQTDVLDAFEAPRPIIPHTQGGSVQTACQCDDTPEPNWALWPPGTGLFPWPRALRGGSTNNSRLQVDSSDTYPERTPTWTQSTTIASRSRSNATMPNPKVPLRAAPAERVLAAPAGAHTI
ncbi:hypothetical protein V8C26DRAFT_69628 [Trichoderma gracile]